MQVIEAKFFITLTVCKCGVSFQACYVDSVRMRMRRTLSGMRRLQLCMGRVTSAATRVGNCRWASHIFHTLSGCGTASCKSFGKNNKILLRSLQEWVLAWLCELLFDQPAHAFSAFFATTPVVGLRSAIDAWQQCGSTTRVATASLRLYRRFENAFVNS